MVTSVKKIATKFKVLCATAVAATVALSAVVANAQSNLIAIDGSSTVFPITEAVAEMYMMDNPGASISVGVSGTGGGFKKFCAGETVISNASRPIKDSELADCQANGINPVQIEVAYDAITVVINPDNTFARNLTTDQLKEIWSSETPPTTWNQIDPSFPNLPLTLYGPGTDSGTFDYFNEVILDDVDSRDDYTASEDDNVLVLGVSRDPNALGYFGMAYFEENAELLDAVAIQGPDTDGNFVQPSPQTINEYKPLARKIFIYVDPAVLAARPEVNSFVEFYLDQAADSSDDNIIAEVGYVPLEPSEYDTFRSVLSN